MGRKFHQVVGIQTNKLRKSLELGFGRYHFEGTLNMYPVESMPGPV
jgi:hypothetical protein